MDNNSPKQFLSFFPGNQIFASSTDRDIPKDDPKYKLKSTPWHYSGEFDDVVKRLLSAQEDNRGIFFTVNELDQSLDEGKKRTKKMFVRARAIWVEDDNKRDEHRADWPIQPNIVVNSSPGKYHYYWLTTTENPKEWENVMKRMVQDYGCDNQAKDIARILRIPGFNHCKGEPHQVTFSVFREKPYSWDAIKVAFPPIEGEIEIPSSGSSSGVMPGMSVAELYQESKGGHMHGPSRSMAMKLANYGMPKDEALAIMIATLPEHHEGHHEQSLDTAYSKIQSEKDEDEQDTLGELPKVIDEPFSRDIDSMPGLMGQLIQECYEMAFYPNKTVATVTALGLVAGIAGRCFNVSKMGLNIYIAIMMDTGTGKDIINKVINSTLYGLPNSKGRSFVGDSGFTGAKAFRQNLLDGLSKISVITEAGLFGKSQSGDKETLRRDMLDAYTKSGKDSYLGALRYSKKEESLQAIRAPAYSIVFESTQKSFIESLRSSDAQLSGELARMWIIRIKDKVPYPNRKVRKKFSPELLRRIEEIIHRAGQIQLPEKDSLLDESGTVIELDFSEEIGYKKMCEFVDARNKEGPDTLKGVMYSRAWEKAIRMAAIISVFNNGARTKKVDEEAFEWVLRNVIDPEIASVDAMFREGVSDDVMEIVKYIIAPQISRMLHGELHGTATPGKTMRLAKMFTRSNLYQALKDKPQIKSFSTSNNNMKVRHGVDKLIEYMEEIGYLRRVGEMEQAKYGIRYNKNVLAMTKSAEELYND